MLKRIVMAIALVAGYPLAGWADDKPLCQVQEINLAMVEKDRKDHERKIAMLATQLEQERTRRQALEQQVNGLMERISKADGEKKPD